LSVSNFDVVVVGGGVAGVQASITAKQSRTSSSVALVSSEPAIYSRPALRSVISGFTDSLNDITIRRSDDLESFGIRLFPNHEALSVNHDERVVHIRNRLTNEALPLRYDKVIIATGSIPAVPSLRGHGLSGVFKVKWFDDALALSHFAFLGMKAYVVGAGLIGLSVAEALARRGLKTTIVVRSRVLRELFESDLSQEITQRIESHGVDVLTGAMVEGIGGERKVEYVIIHDQKFDADIVVFAAGVQPNTLIAAQTGLQLADNNAIKTDTHMKTSFEDVYAAGDCAETLDLVTHKFVYRPLGSIATYSAKVAGSNVVGVEETYDGFLRMQCDKIFGNEMLSMGLSTEEARRLGVAGEAVDISLKGPKCPMLLPLIKSKALIKAIIQKNTDTVIGWQVVGSGQSSWASLFLQEMIRDKCSISDIQELGLNIEQASDHCWWYVNKGELVLKLLSSECQSS